MGKEPLASKFGQVEKVPLVKAGVQTEGKEQVTVGRSNPNLPCNLMTGTDFPLIEGWTQKKRFKKEAKVEPSLRQIKEWSRSRK